MLCARGLDNAHRLRESAAVPPRRSARCVLHRMRMRGMLVVGRYVVGDRIGVGGMGVVHDAEDLARTERVAIKLLQDMHLTDVTAAAHMEREARIGQACRHTNVVTVLDGGRMDGRPFVVMEYVAGQPLGKLAAESSFSIHRALTLVEQILEGVGAIHRAGFVHGDLKSDNVLVSRTRDGVEVAKIIDFGLAREADSRRDEHDTATTISGTPDYVAPELVEGGAKTIASDLYAVGVILYELLTGATPFGGDTSSEVLRRHVEDDVVPPSLRRPELRISLALERVVMRALDKCPASRYSDAAAFASALRAAGATVPKEDASFELVSRAPTQEWTRPDLPVSPLALGTYPPRSREPAQLIAVALDIAQKRIAEHRPAAAARELEAALDLIDGRTSDVPGAWRVLLPLAAVYDRLGDPQRARRTARLALDRAIRVGSALGRRRAKALIARFAGRTRTLA